MTTTGEAFASDIRAANAPGGPVFHLPQPSVNPLNWMGGIWRATVAAANTAEHAVVGRRRADGHFAQPRAGVIAELDRSPGCPRYSAARDHLADMKQVCRAFDVTLNDVALAAITNSYRTILLDRGEKLRPPNSSAHACCRCRSAR